MEIEAIEVIPLERMPTYPRPMPAAEGMKRIGHLNQLNAQELGAEGAVFRARVDGSGLLCAVAKPTGVRARVLCP